MKPKLLPLVCLLIPMFASADIASNQMLGHWRFADATMTGEYVFRDDGTYTANIAQGGKVVWSCAGIWSLEGNILHYELTRSSLERIPPGTKDADKLVEITRDYFVIETRGGARRKYMRVQNFETANVNIGYLSQDVFSARMTVSKLADYVKRLQMVCADFFAQTATPEYLGIVVAVKPGRRSRVWFVSSSAAEANDYRDKLRAILENVLPPESTGGPVAFAISGRIAGGSGADSNPAGQPPMPREWRDAVSKAKAPVQFDEIIRLVWPD